jgi:hypothetical protein
MTTEQLRAATSARPFMPFTIRTASGQTYRIDHPELVLVPPQGRSFAFSQDGATISVLEVLMIKAIEYETQGATGGS